jgi:hypothetical protein
MNLRRRGAILSEETQELSMNHKHRKVLHALFAHPVSANISPGAVESVFQELGGDIEQRHGGRIGVRLNGHFAEFHHPQHALHPDEVRNMRKFLEQAGVDPGRDYPI